jgi:two-component sensor histidine kinase
MREDYNIEGYSLQELLEDDRFKDFVSIIHDFTVQTSKALTPSEIYSIITSKLASRLSLTDCVIYAVDEQQKTLEQVAAFGPKMTEGSDLKNKLVLQFGQGHAGLAAEHKISILIEDCSISKNYVEDLELAGSEIEVPIIHNDKVYAVISSEHKEKRFFSAYHLKLFEIVAAITGGYVAKLTEQMELNSIKNRLEEILKKKSNDLDMVVESLSDKYTALKLSHEKREILMQEVHHRVNNNLQVISSMLNLYAKYPENNSQNVLQEVQKRVQAMALVHQNFYKSFEKNLVNINSYLFDLLNYLKSYSHNTLFSFEINTRTTFISIDKLVPFGLLLTEIVAIYLRYANENDAATIALTLNLSKEVIENTLHLTIEDELDTDLSANILIGENSADNISNLFIEALLEQLNATLTCSFQSGNKLIVSFSEA